jgi:hypothetical protein
MSFTDCTLISSAPTEVIQYPASSTNNQEVEIQANVEAEEIYKNPQINDQPVVSQPHINDQAVALQSSETVLEETAKQVMSDEPIVQDEQMDCGGPSEQNESIPEIAEKPSLNTNEKPPEEKAKQVTIFVPQQTEEKMRLIESGQAVVSVTENRKSLIIISKNADDIDKLRKEWHVADVFDSSHTEEETADEKDMTSMANAEINTSIMEIEPTPMPPLPRVKEALKTVAAVVVETHVRRESVDREERNVVKPLISNSDVSDPVAMTGPAVYASSPKPRAPMKKIREIFNSTPKVSQAPPQIPFNIPQVSVDAVLQEAGNKRSVDKASSSVAVSSQNKSKNVTPQNSKQQQPSSDASVRNSSSRSSNSGKYFSDFFSNIKDDDEDIYGNQVSNATAANAGRRNDEQQRASSSFRESRPPSVNQETNSVPSILLLAQKVQEKAKSNLKSRQLSGGKRGFHN